MQKAKQLQQGKLLLLDFHSLLVAIPLSVIAKADLNKLRR